MSGEHTRPNPDNSELKRPLQKSDLIGPSVQASDSDDQEAKEHYTRQLESILSTPLVPENFNTYAEDALNNVVSLVDDMTISYPGESLPLPRGRAEEHTARHYAMDIDQILDSLADKVDETKRINDFVDSIGEHDEVYVPPQLLQPPIQPGTGEFTKKETKPKLQTILFLLQERYELDIQDPSQVVVSKGSVTPDMMRKEPYYLIEVPELNRTILVCNEIGNITYVMDSEKLDNHGIESELLVDLDKTQIDQLLQTEPALGVRISHTKKYIPKIELALESIQNFITKTEAGIDQDTEIAEESLLLPAVDKAPEGYLSVNGISGELGVSMGAVSKIIKELGLTPDIEKARFGKVSAEAYSPDQIAMIREDADAKGLFSQEAPAGYLSATGIADELDVSNRSVSKIIKELGLTPDIEQARFGTVVTGAYSPEQIAMIRESAEAKGLFSSKAPEGYLSVRGIAGELEVSTVAVRNLIKELGLTPAIEQARFGSIVAEAYSPDQIAMIRENADAKGLFSQEAPAGYLSAAGIADELKVYDSTVSKIINELGLTPAIEQARFGRNVAGAYSPEQIAMIREDADAKGLFSPEAPEGYLSVKGVARELRASDRSVSKIIKELGLTPDIEQARFSNVLTGAYSPEQIAMIREGAEAKGLLSPEAPEGYLNVRGIAGELRVGNGTVRNLIKELGLTPDVEQARFGSNVVEAYSPDQIAMIRERLAAKRENKS